MGIPPALKEARFIHLPCFVGSHLQKQGLLQSALTAEVVFETGRNALHFALADEYPQRLPRGRVSTSAFDVREESHKLPSEQEEGEKR